MSTVHEHLEAIRDDWLFEESDDMTAPHPIYQHAVAALELLNEAEYASGPTMYPIRTGRSVLILDVPEVGADTLPNPVDTTTPRR